MTENKDLNGLLAPTKEELNKFFEVAKEMVANKSSRTEEYYVHYNILGLVLALVVINPQFDEVDEFKEILEIYHTHDSNPYYRINPPVEILEVKDIKDIEDGMKVVEVNLSTGKLMKFVYSPIPKDISGFKKRLFEDNDVLTYIDSYSGDLVVGSKIPARILILDGQAQIIEFDGVSMLASMFEDIEDIGFAESYVKYQVGPVKN